MRFGHVVVTISMTIYLVWRYHLHMPNTSLVVPLMSAYIDLGFDFVLVRLMAALHWGLSWNGVS